MAPCYTWTNKAGSKPEVQTHLRLTKQWRFSSKHNTLQVPHEAESSASLLSWMTSFTLPAFSVLRSPAIQWGSGWLKKGLGLSFLEDDPLEGHPRNIVGFIFFSKSDL